MTHDKSIDTDLMCVGGRESIMGGRAKRSSPESVCIPEITRAASDFCGIQTHKGEVRSAWVPMISSISSTMFFPVINSPKHWK